MSINLTDELLAKTKKGKIASAKQVFLEGDQENLQQIGEKTHQLEDAIKDITVSGGASTANAVSYNNETSGMTAITAQGAIDELAAKNKAQDATIGTKAEKSEVATELDKKFDNENIAQEFGDSEDKVVSQFALPFREIESPEFIKVIVDANDHLLFTINLDGEVDWGKGIPAPIRAKLQEIINQCQQDKTDVLEAINAVKGELSASITALQEGKVDKEEGKSLIEDEVKECFRVIENEEFLKAIVDSDDKVLFGFRRDTGKPYYPLNEMYHVEQNEEYFALWLDAANHVLLGIRRDGEIIGEIHACNALKQIITKIQEDLTSLQDKVGTIDANLSELLSVFSLQENEEYLAVETDADGRVLAATYPDGSHYAHNMKSETIPTEIGHFEDPEGRTEITTDADGRVLGERREDGEKHEVKMDIDNLKVSNLNLQDNSVNDIQDALKANGFDVKGKTDWSNWYETHDCALELPIPRKAILNITGVDKMPEKKLVNDKAYIEYFDFNGNYFKIKAYLNAQGASTMADPMKSCAIDLFSDEWDGNAFEIKFGSWVAQDGFHLKALWKDALKSIQPVCYELGNQITKALDARSNRFHVRASESLLGGTGDMKKDFDQALCMPSQFPVEVYLNGEYYGLFLWSLKKNRANYSMDKKDYKSILIDNVGSIFRTTDQTGFNWQWGEIRNPKTLICVDGKKYDADTHLGELIGTDTVAGKQYTFSRMNEATTGSDTFEVTSIDYDPSNKDMVNTAKTKDIIKKCQKYLSEVNKASTTEIKKELAEKYFDIPNLIAYIIFTELTYNQDGWINNAQITIFDNKVGYNIYDCDSCLGKSWAGWLWTSSLSREIISGDLPLGIVKNIFSDRVKEAYKTLRDKDIISKENCNSVVDEWCKRIGYEAFSRSIKKWNTSPSYKAPTNLDSHWTPYIPTSTDEANDISQYDAETSYGINDLVKYGNGGYNDFYYKCTEACVGTPPITNGQYYANGMYDSPERIKTWLEKRIEFCDKLWNYNN
nr:MAG TPA: Spore coat protein H kinase fold, TRANSFERASE [Caudoviricetes sp.]